MKNNYLIFIVQKNYNLWATVSYFYGPQIENYSLYKM